MPANHPPAARALPKPHGYRETMQVLCVGGAYEAIRSRSAYIGTHDQWYGLQRLCTVYVMHFSYMTTAACHFHALLNSTLFWKSMQLTLHITMHPSARSVLCSPFHFKHALCSQCNMEMYSTHAPGEAMLRTTQFMMSLDLIQCIPVLCLLYSRVNLRQCIYLTAGY